ncbi:MAG: hypothetical protein KatS3mg102_1885 [Planctomycetota bacterium]|nr:MAG: hypothetical protein KatS3mg102_1885 [Planctomycetota bacterium]
MAREPAGTAAGGDIRRYLLPDVLARLRGLDLVARLVVEGFVTGLHRSPYHGFSVEFAEYREYTPGDEIKHIDWKVFGRTDRYYVKVYEEETNLQAFLVLDKSASMRLQSPEAPASKLQYATWIAASLAYLMLAQRDSVGLVTFDTEVRDFVPPSQHPSHLKVMLGHLDQMEPGHESDLGAVMHALAEQVRRKGLFIVISDLLDDPEKILFGLRHLRYRRHEVILFQVLDPAERTFPLRDMTKLVALEGEAEEIVDPIAIRKSYLEELERFLDAIRNGCRNTRTDYVLLDTSMPLGIALARYLATRSEVKLR